MEHILEHQLKELYSLWNFAYTQNGPKRMSYYSVFVLTQSTIQKANAVPKDMRRVVHAKADRQQYLKKI